MKKKKIITSSAPTKTCSFCSGSAAEGGGNYLSTSSLRCPICGAKWNNLPFPGQRRLPATASASSVLGKRPSAITHVPMQNFPSYAPVSVSFRDDEPLPDDGPTSSMAPLMVSIWAVPERGAVAASESVPEFAVLVGVRAPPLSSRAPIDIVTVLDVSGSMKGMKLSLLQRAVHFVIDNLGPSDRLSIVSFSGTASRVFPLRRMTPAGCNEAKRAVDSLAVLWTGTNITEGLRAGVRVLGERRYENPVAAIMFLSDGCDTFNLRASFRARNVNQPPQQSIFPKLEGGKEEATLANLVRSSIFPRLEAGKEKGAIPIPVHTFGFGADHDPIMMHAIADASGGTFSFIESYEMVQDALAGCIGGLLSVVAQEIRLRVRSASRGVRIKSIPSGGYQSQISNQDSEGLIHAGDLYADEEKEFLINVSVPACSDGNKTKLLDDIMCSYKDAVSKQAVMVEGDLVEIKRPRSPSPRDLAICVEVDRQKSRLRAAEGMKQAQQMAETGNLSGATKLLKQERDELMATASAKAEDGMVVWMEGEMKETERRFESKTMYEKSGRAFALAGMSSHASQRATTRGGLVAGGGMFFGGYATKQMSEMVHKSQQQEKKPKIEQLKIEYDLQQQEQKKPKIE